MTAQRRKVTTGELESSMREGSPAELVRELMATAQEPGDDAEPKGRFRLDFTRKKVPREDVMHFSRQLASFIRAGIPILEAIGVIKEETGNKVFRETLFDLGEALERGETFSSATAAHKRVFPTFYVSLLRSAELTGNLEIVLEQLAHYMERELETRRKIQAALAYPAVILVMAVITVIILAGVVLPRFSQFFESFDATLPLPTRILLAFSSFLAGTWWLFLIGLFLLGVAAAASQRTYRGRGVKDWLLLHIPIIRDVVRFGIVERFCRSLSSMMQAGVPLPDAMVVAADAANNIQYSKALANVREDMLRGEGIARPLSSSGVFPSAVTQMVRVGEDTGSLPEQLEGAAQYFEQELTYKIRRLTNLFEPAVIVCMGLVVGFIALALVSAMYGVFQQSGAVG